MSENQNSRSVDQTIEIDAAIGDVWNAISRSELVPGWYAPEAEVKPGVGGSYTVGWGPGMRGTMAIDVWEENKRLRVADPADARGLVKAIDFLLEGRSGKTVLRLVHSGFGLGTEWDSEIDGFEKGWALFLGNLKHYVERHGNARPWQVGVLAMTPLSQDQVWERLLAAGGVSREGLGSLAVGSSCAATIGDPEITLAGSVRLAAAPTFFSATVERPGPGLFQITVEKGPGLTMVGLNLFAYGREWIPTGLHAHWTSELARLAPP